MTAASSTDSPDTGRMPALRPAGLLIATGVLHVLTPGFFDSIVPRTLPGRARTYTHLSDVAEPGVGAALVAPRIRRLGGLLAALLFVAVFPGQYPVHRGYGEQSEGAPAVEADLGAATADAAAADHTGADGAPRPSATAAESDTTRCVHERPRHPPRPRHRYRLRRGARPRYPSALPPRAP